MFNQESHYCILVFDTKRVFLILIIYYNGKQKYHKDFILGGHLVCKLGMGRYFCFLYLVLECGLNEHFLSNIPVFFFITILVLCLKPK